MAGWGVCWERVMMGRTQGGENGTRSASWETPWWAEQRQRAACPRSAWPGQVLDQNLSKKHAMWMIPLGLLAQQLSVSRW